MARARFSRAYYARDTREVARDLLGARLVRVLDDGTRLSGRIVETEAYREGDAASHSFRRRTVRNAPMFGRPGLAYVYFTYGMHFCFNVVTERDGYGAAVLIRALEPEEGIAVMRANRLRARTSPLSNEALCRGPANVCRALGIGRSFSGCDLCARGSALFIEPGQRVPDARIATSPRIGVAGDAVARCVAWRWYVVDSPCVSARARPSAAAL